MTHLTPDELIDAMEGALAPGRQSHLATCDECRCQVAGLQDTLRDAKQVSVPEPAPMFWPHLSQRISAAIENAPTPDRAWPSWLRWQTLLPIGAVAMIILALMIAVPKREPANDVAEVPPPAELPSDSWDTVADLVGVLDVETASATGVIGPGVAERAVLELTADERQELTRLLKEELTRAKS